MVKLDQVPVTAQMRTQKWNIVCKSPGVAWRFCDLSWCKCGSCSVATLSHDEECLCCHKIPSMQHRILLEEEELNSSTASVYFPIFCCDVESLGSGITEDG